MGILENDKKTNELLNYYGLSKEQQREFWNIIRHIFNHEEFLLQRWIMVTEGDGRYVVPIIADDGEFSR